jgi:hypothetical protein
MLPSGVLRGLLVSGKWPIGVGVLALALSSGVAVAQTPTPDPAPAPPPASEPVTEPTPEPEPATEPSSRPSRTNEAQKKSAEARRHERPEAPLALRLPRLHPPLAEEGSTDERGADRASDLVPLSDVHSTGSGSRAVPLGVVLLALAGVCVVLVGLLAAPARLTGGASQQLAAHREHLAVGGFAVLLGLMIGVLIPLLLQ